MFADAAILPSRHNFGSRYYSCFSGAYWWREIDFGKKTTNSQQSSGRKASSVLQPQKGRVATGCYIWQKTSTRVLLPDWILHLQHQELPGTGRRFLLLPMIRGKRGLCQNRCLHLTATTTMLLILTVPSVKRWDPLTVEIVLLFCQRRGWRFFWWEGSTRQWRQQQKSSKNMLVMMMTGTVLHRAAPQQVVWSFPKGTFF